MQRIYAVVVKVLVWCKQMTKSLEPVALVTDCYATVIPSGLPILLVAGSKVEIIQDLGGTYTVQYQGQWVRIAAQDAAALGEAYVKPGVETTWDENTTLEQKVWSLLKTCYDPEIPVDIVELGLIYSCQLFEVDSGFRVHIMMTLTAPGCGMGPVLMEDIKQKLHNLTDVRDVQLEWVFDPPWTQSMMSDAAKLKLGLF